MEQIGVMEQTSSRNQTPRPTRSATRVRNRAARPGIGDVRLRMGALGLSPLGVQAVATVDAVGPEVVGFAPGDRVAMREPGTRAGFQRVVSERDLIGIPKDVSFDAAAAILPSGLVARTILRQIHAIGRGNRIYVTPDDSGSHLFVEAWATHLGAVVVGESERPTADVVVSTTDYRAAERWRYGPGLAQLAASDVFQAMRDGAFNTLEISRHPLADAARVHSDVTSRRTTGPVVLMPGIGELAA
jgi:NADPH:quinone reductase-like Zn-dependent oxidoreductase